jgi:FtsH-binding integral membrane protein
MADAARAGVHSSETDLRVRAFVQKVYGWMAAALAVTGLVAMAVARSATLQQFIFGNTFVFFGLIIAELILVMVLVRRLPMMTASTATVSFIIYSLLNGLTLSSIFLVYTQGTIARAFFVTAGVFAVMTIYGFFTKRDLTRMGSLLGMALLGFIIASLVNLFLRSEAFYWIITYAGVVIFVGLIAFDSQRIKELALQGVEDDEVGQKVAIMGALRLYLDFVNLFLLLLRIFGRRR